MKYKIFSQIPKEIDSGGDYWRDADFHEHLQITSYQTTYQYLLHNYRPPKKILEAGCE